VTSRRFVDHCRSCAWRMTHFGHAPPKHNYFFYCTGSVMIPILEASRSVVDPMSLICLAHDPLAMHYHIIARDR
jgi:hypothetical protein